MSNLATIRSAIISCDRCPRLRSYCERIGREKRAAFRDEAYWARPVPGFGDPDARILLIGLAPAAHGANRTGRNFTGDGVGGSGDFLMAALHANGLANQPFSRGIDDGLELRNAWIAAAVRCAPPDNKPLPEEIAACYPHLAAEAAALPHLRVIVALGRIGFDAAWRLVMDRMDRGAEPSARGRATERRTAKPPFGHGLTYHPPDAPIVIASYHPSRQNTNTGRLTPPMLDLVLRTAASLALLGTVDVRRLAEKNFG
jgi:uracil-DNA glycosylase family 4